MGATPKMSVQSVKIEMPQLSSDGESATLASWLVAVGDRVAQGDVIAELETDKATVELECPASGTIGELVVAEGSEGIAPGTLLGRIDSAGAPSEASPDREKAVSPAMSPAMSPAKAPPSADAEIGEPVGSSALQAGAAPVAAPPPAASVANEGTRSTPLARRAALANEVDLNDIAGSGPRGRVVEADVLRASKGEPRSAAPVAGEGPSTVAKAGGVAAKDSAPIEGAVAVRLSSMRKTIARRLTESKQQVPHFYLSIRVSMDPVIEVRARLNAGLAEEGRDLKISVNDFVLRAAALALQDVPAANVQFAGDVMHVFERVDVSVAVATEGGLLTPVVRDANRKGLTKLAEEVKALAGQARAGKLSPDQYQGGTFTISNLGMYGIESVYPILNPPQACILGVGAADEQPVIREGEITIGRVAVLTLAADHRAVDGAVGAELLSAIRSRLEDPMGMIL